LELCRLLYEQGKTVWIYTGNVVNPEKLMYEELMYYVEVIVDGRFIEEKKDPNLLFRGSSNQRIIDLRWSVLMGEIIEWRNDSDEMV
jgi:anaerobic ribonucleoside-triphosphate reductase activating protein